MTKMPCVKKNILFVNNTSKMGAGTSQSLCSLLKYLSPFYGVSVVSDRKSQELPKALLEMDIPHYAYHDRAILFLPELIYHILAKNIDLVYGNNLSGRTRVAFWAARITRRPFIWHIRESLKKDDKRGKEVHLANAVIANSIDTARRLIEFAGVKIPVVISNGLEFEAYQVNKDLCRNQLIKLLGCSSDSIFVINMGRVCSQKNQIEAIQVGLNILKKYPQTHFLFLGALQDSVYVNQICQKINTSEYQDNFHILGHIKDFIPYLLGSDILFHTSRTESQGRVILEAMASKLPVIAYEVGGVGEAVVQGETGYLRPFGDIDGLAQDLGQLLESPTLRSTFGSAGYLRVQKYFTAENTAMQVKNILDKVLF